MRIARVAAIGLCLAVQAAALAAQTGDVGAVVERLQAAQQALAEAEGSLEQRRALSRAIRAYEAALGTLSEMQVVVGQELRQRSRALDRQQGDLRRRLAALARLGDVSDDIVLLGRADPKEAARASLAMRHLATVARSQVEELRHERRGLLGLAEEQSALARKLTETRESLSAAREDLIARVEDVDAEAEELPGLETDAAALAALAIAFESGITAESPVALPLAPASLLPPVEGGVLRPFGAEDESGLSRPGLTLAGLPEGLVISPAEATVRFVGRIDGYGQVAVLEPAPGVLLMIAGFGRLLARAGATVEAGEPLGFLPAAADHEEFSDPDGPGTGLPGVKALYIELRYEQAPVDPERWFAD